MLNKLILAFCCICAVVLLSGFVWSDYQTVDHSARDTGVSGLWILANISYAGMRAQDHPRARWRILSFIFGFPGTLLSLFFVTEGGERVYGIQIPTRLR